MWYRISSRLLQTDEDIDISDSTVDFHQLKYILFRQKVPVYSVTIYLSDCEKYVRVVAVLEFLSSVNVSEVVAISF